MAPIELTFDITASLDQQFSTGNRLRIAAWLFLPEGVQRLPAVPPVIACLNGGSYDRRYFNAQIPGYPGYSMAEHLARSGAIVIVLDHLGIGASSRPSCPSQVTRQVAAAANHAALQQAYEKIAKGALHPSLPAFESIQKIGVGHSMGSMQTITQQSNHSTYDRVIILGYTAIGVHLLINGQMVSADPGPPDPRASPYWTLDRRLTRASFHWEDVPEDIMAADDALNVEVPYLLSSQSITAGIVSEDAGRIRVPVFICLGERDVSPDPHAEPGYYRGSRDVTLLILPRSGHCHTFAGTRRVLWDRMMRWIATPSAE
jgi:alpha-beta hydrolase superfamily lysophospholipase